MCVCVCVESSCHVEVCRTCIANPQNMKGDKPKLSVPEPSSIIGCIRFAFHLSLIMVHLLAVSFKSTEPCLLVWSTGNYSNYTIYLILAYTYDVTLGLKGIKCQKNNQLTDKIYITAHIHTCIAFHFTFLSHI